MYVNVFVFPCHAHISSIHGSFCGRMLTECSHALCLLYIFSFMMVSPIHLPEPDTLVVRLARWNNRIYITHNSVSTHC